MREGTVPVLPYRPCAESADDVLPVLVVSHFWGAEAVGGETPLERSVFFEHFSRAYFFL
jgi:hypothetical protein